MNSAEVLRVQSNSAFPWGNTYQRSSTGEWAQLLNANMQIHQRFISNVCQRPKSAILSLQEAMIMT